VRQCAILVVGITTWRSGTLDILGTNMSRITQEKTDMLEQTIQFIRDRNLEKDFVAYLQEQGDVPKKVAPKYKESDFFSPLGALEAAVARDVREIVDQEFLQELLASAEPDLPAKEFRFDITKELISEIEEDGTCRKVRDTVSEFLTARGVACCWETIFCVLLEAMRQTDMLVPLECYLRREMDEIHKEITIKIMQQTSPDNPIKSAIRRGAERLEEKKRQESAAKLEADRIAEAKRKADEKYLREKLSEWLPKQLEMSTERQGGIYLAFPWVQGYDSNPFQYYDPWMVKKIIEEIAGEFVKISVSKARSGDPDYGYEDYTYISVLPNVQRALG